MRFNIDLKFWRSINFVAVLIFFQLGARAQAVPPPNTLGFIPASISEIDMAFPLQNKWHISTQLDLQLVTQGAYDNKNPFAYAQRLTARPWIIYNGFKNMKIWLGYTDMKKYEIKSAGNYATHEQRITVMGTFAQKLPKGSMFEQLRVEEKWFDDKNGNPQAYPRLRMRFGVNHFLSQHAAKPLFRAPNLSYYFELMIKFAPE